MGNAHAFAAATGRRLDHHRIADLVGDLHRMFRAIDDAEIARHGRDLGGIGEFLRLDLVAHRRDGARIGSDEGDASLLQRLGKSFTLGKKAIARMNGLGPGLLTGGHDPIDDEIRFRGRRRADVDGLVGHRHMERVAIGVRIDRHRGNSHTAGGFDDTAGNLAPIGDEDLFEHSGPDGRRSESADPT